MDRSMPELVERVEILEKELAALRIEITKLILMIHVADTDLKNHVYLLDS